VAGRSNFFAWFSKQENHPAGELIWRCRGKGRPAVIRLSSSWRFATGPAARPGSVETCAQIRFFQGRHKVLAITLEEKQV